jgi:hypothetical protein
MQRRRLLRKAGKLKGTEVRDSKLCPGRREALRAGSGKGAIFTRLHRFGILSNEREVLPQRRAMVRPKFENGQASAREILLIALSHKVNA